MIVWSMLLSCPAKKVTKERGIGEALSVALPRAKDALSYVPLPSRITITLKKQSLQTAQKKRQSGESGAAAFDKAANRKQISPMKMLRTVIVRAG